MTTEHTKIETELRAADTGRPLPSLANAREEMKRGHFDMALTIARELLTVNKDSRDARYIETVALRYLVRLDEAMQSVDVLINTDAAYGRAYQEKGHIARLQGQHSLAITAFDQAVRLNPALLASWKALHALAAEGASGKEVAARQVARLEGLAPHLVSVESMMHEGALFKAEQLCRQYLKAHPKDAEGMRLLAQLGLKLNILDDAEFLLESALAFAPDHHLARHDYVTVLHRRQKYQQAYEEAERLAKEEPDNPAFQSALANAALAIGQYDRAITLYDQLSTDYPDLPVNHLVRGHALKTVGRGEDAITSYRRAYEVKPEFGDAYWSLANLKTFSFTDDELKMMESQISRDEISTEDRYHLCFALGKGLEDRQLYDESFAYYEKGNALKKPFLHYSSEQMLAEFEAQKEIFTKDFLASRRDFGATSKAPIFIVGLPRAGSTLLEQILSSHSQVTGTLELPNILALVHRLNGRRKVGDDPRYPKIVQALTSAQCTEFGQAYIDDTAIYRGESPRFTDKMPNNFRHLGLIHMILPDAKIIDARREPIACCFSGFKQLFAEGQEFTYSLEDIGRYYRGYVDLMKHWNNVLSGKILRMQYEDVVTDLETQVRRLLDFCELPFESACLEFHKTKRSVRTASAEQVRQPLYTSGVDQWRHFEQHLEPLVAALGSALTEYNQ